MTVGELIALLQAEDPGRLVIVQKDGEGNGYSPLECLGYGKYVPETTWRGEVFIESLTEEMRDMGYGDDDLTTDPSAVSALIIIPVS